MSWVHSIDYLNLLWLSYECDTSKRAIKQLLSKVLEIKIEHIVQQIKSITRQGRAIWKADITSNTHVVLKLEQSINNMIFDNPSITVINNGSKHLPYSTILWIVNLLQFKFIVAVTILRSNESRIDKVSSGWNTNQKPYALNLLD